MLLSSSVVYSGKPKEFLLPDELGSSCGIIGHSLSSVKGMNTAKLQHVGPSSHLIRLDDSSLDVIREELNITSKGPDTATAHFQQYKKLVKNEVLMTGYSKSNQEEPVTPLPQLFVFMISMV